MIDILMPRLSDTMTEGAVATWHKKPGDPVRPGDLLLEIETDKAIMEQEAYEAGVLAEILVSEGESVSIGTPIARLDDGIDHPAAPAPHTAEAVEHSPATVAPATPEAGPAPGPAAASSSGDERIFATPLVRRLARERGIDLGGLVGSGPGGRIVRADLDASGELPATSDSAPAARGLDTAVARDAKDGVRRVPFDPIRRTIATRLTESATTVPVFHVTASADVTELLALRSRINASIAESGEKVSVNDLVIKAAALALTEHPVINASYSSDAGGQTLFSERIDIGIAVAAPSGLVVPVVRDPASTRLSAIAAQTRELAARATERKLSAADLSGGTFTVSNLGMFGVEQFTAIINPPQGAILAVGTLFDELTLVGDDVGARTRIRYTLTSDHRIIDGADAGRFLATLTGLLEAPLRLLI